MTQNYFLLQVSDAFNSYPNIINNHMYQNGAWASKPKDVAHGDVRPGDMLLVYCTGSVSACPSSIAFQVQVKSVSEDKTVLFLDEPDWFDSPLTLKGVHKLVAQGGLAEAFKSCGQEGFNIRHLSPQDAQTAIEVITQKHIQTAQNFLAAADQEFTAGDVLQGSEKLWGAASHIVMAAAQQRGWPYGKHSNLKSAVRRLYQESGDELLLGGFTSAEQCHANFYHDFMEDFQVEEARIEVPRFVNRMRDFIIDA